MKINDTPIIRNAGSVKKRPGAVGNSSDFQSFFAPESEALETGQPVNESAAASSLNAMLALQEVPEDLLQKRKAISQGQQALDSLEKLRHALLMGTIQPEVMQQLKRSLPERASVIDPKLAAILDEIELRMAVELAKLETARAY